MTDRRQAMEAPVTTPEPGEWLRRVREGIRPVCESLVSEADVDGGGVALLSSRGTRNVVFASDDVSKALEDLQIDLAEGPCVDAAVERAPVMAADLRDADQGYADRWPFFVPRVDALGVRGVFAFPLLVGPMVLGTLELYRLAKGLLDERQLSAAVEATDELGRSILDLSQVGGLGDMGSPGAFVHQAAGMVMVQIDSTIDGAMAFLRAQAFVEGRSLVELSAEVVRGERNFRRETG
jgi:hypothetical protein